MAWSFSSSCAGLGPAGSGKKCIFLMLLSGLQRLQPQCQWLSATSSGTRRDVSATTESCERRGWLVLCLRDGQYIPDDGGRRAAGRAPDRRFACGLLQISLVPHAEDPPLTEDERTSPQPAMRMSFRHARMPECAACRSGSFMICFRVESVFVSTGPGPRYGFAEFLLRFPP